MHRISVDIKQVSIKELHQLQNLGKQTFYEIFAASNTQEDMKSILPTVSLPAKLVPS